MDSGFRVGVEDYSSPAGPNAPYLRVRKFNRGSPKRPCQPFAKLQMGIFKGGYIGVLYGLGFRVYRRYMGSFKRGS